MARPFTLAYRNQVADLILSAIAPAPLACREIAEQIGITDKETYKHLVFMESTLGIVRKERVEAANVIGGVATLWAAQPEEEPKNDIKRVIWSDWPRGEHGRDRLVAALFGRG